MNAMFHGVARPGSVVTFRNLFLHPMDKAPQIDGYRDEWVHVENNFSALQSVDDTLEARIFLGQHGRYLYLLLGVKDPQVALGEQGDAVDLALTDGNGMLQRYRIQPQAPGWVVARRLGPDPKQTDAVDYEAAIRGEWQPHEQGYTLELRFPRDLVQDRLSLRFYDSHSRQLLASGHMFPADATRTHRGTLGPARTGADLGHAAGHAGMGHRSPGPGDRTGRPARYRRTTQRRSAPDALVHPATDPGGTPTRGRCRGRPAG